MSTHENPNTTSQSAEVYDESEHAERGLNAVERMEMSFNAEDYSLTGKETEAVVDNYLRSLGQ